MSGQGKEVNDNPSSGNSEKSWMIQLGRYLQIGFALPAATVIGWLLGRFLDRQLHTSWLYMAGLIVGTTAGFVGLIRLASKPESDGDGG
jgi:F0F1-type ATP synthase assembly protein I